MVLVAGDLGARLVGLLADADRNNLITVVLGSTGSVRCGRRLPSDSPHPFAVQSPSLKVIVTVAPSPTTMPFPPVMRTSYFPALAPAGSACLSNA